MPKYGISRDPPSQFLPIPNKSREKKNPSPTGPCNPYCCLRNSPGPEQLEAAVNIWLAPHPGDPIGTAVFGKLGQAAAVLLA